MRAIVCEQFGPPEVLHLKDVPKPSPGDDEVLVKVRATTVTAADWRCRSKTVPRGMGLAAGMFLGFTRPRHPILGTELAGVVESVGKAVTRFKAGDRVFAFPGLSMGCHVEYRCIAHDGPIAISPANLSDEEAAALSFGGVTALRFLAKGKIERGQAVLVNGASGGVGTAAVQIAKHFGATVTGVCSAANVALVRSLGAYDVVDYTQEDFTRSGKTYDIIVDTAGTAPLPRCRGSLKPDGRLLLVVGDLAGALQSMGNKRIVFGSPPPYPDELPFLAQLAEAGEYRPVIDRRYPLEDAVEAHRYVDTGHKKGNVILTVS
jgi:NADPH:quinone reductase-like Zn-dependent oxidoreductase